MGYRGRCRNKKMKRVLDILGAALGLLLLSPLLIVVAVLIHYNMGSPVLYRQTRPGLLGKPFTMIKFRTMQEAFDSGGDPLPDSVRLTRLGAFLRASSLDELPELWNVIKGDMSLIGPRPLLMEYLPLYSADQARRHDVRPGLTGWAQINGRNSIAWEDKFALDVWYVENRSFLLDFKILFLTIFKIIRRSDISAHNEATMPKFTGSQFP